MHLLLADATPMFLLITFVQIKKTNVYNTAVLKLAASFTSFVTNAAPRLMGFCNEHKESCRLVKTSILQNEQTYYACFVYTN